MSGTQMHMRAARPGLVPSSYASPVSPPHQAHQTAHRSARAGSPEDIRWLQSVRLVEPFDCSPPEPGFWENVVVSLQLLLHLVCRSALPDGLCWAVMRALDHLLHGLLLAQSSLLGTCPGEIAQTCSGIPSCAGCHRCPLEPGFPVCCSVS